MRVGGMRWMDVEEAMGKLSVSRQRVHALIRKGALRGKTEGTHTWVTLRSVKSYQERRRRWLKRQRERIARAD